MPARLVQCLPACLVQCLPAKHNITYLLAAVLQSPLFQHGRSFHPLQNEPVSHANSQQILLMLLADW